MIRTAVFASLTLLALAALACCSPLFAAEAASLSTGEGYVPPLWTLLPFLGILLSIAVVPLISHAFWEKRYPQISALWLVLGLTAMLISTVLDPNWSWSQAYGGQLFRSYEEYFSFIVLLGSLFVISGGLYVGGSLRGTVWTNTIILTVGSLLASLIGTTGAAMVLIRPLLRANEQRRYRAHTVVFFIFLVCNIGGALTPIGDPPLFLGFLQGIPFTWTLNLTPLWAFSVIIVLLIYFILDSVLVRREAPRALQPTGQNIRRDAKPRALHLEGSYNLLLLLGVVAAVVASGWIHFETTLRVGSLGVLHLENLLRDGTLIGLALLSWYVTPRRLRTLNAFHFEPIREVAILFAAIFTCVAPALLWLSARGASLGLASPNDFFWVTGILSSFLDNAPTYLTFLATAMGQFGFTEAIQMIDGGEAERILLAISAGAVFMGALTYIGNGPNLMVRAISDQQGVKMPSFFGFAAIAVVVLIPVYLLLSLLFFL